MTTITLNADFISAMGDILSLGITALFLGGLTTSLVETVKTLGIKSAWFYKAVALALSIGVTFLFSEKLKIGLDYIDMTLLCAFTFAMSQGWYQKLEESSGFFGQLFKSISNRYGEKIVGSAEEKLALKEEILKELYIKLDVVTEEITSTIAQSPELIEIVNKILEGEEN